MRSLTFLLLPLLASCDAWPTIVDNRASSQISFQYLHRDYDHWSSPVSISAGTAMPLARAHWIQDIKGIRVRDGARAYALSDASLRRLQGACPSSELARKYAVAGNCYLIYLGRGRLQVMATEPQELHYEQVGNGS